MMIRPIKYALVSKLHLHANIVLLSGRLAFGKASGIEFTVKLVSVDNIDVLSGTCRAEVAWIEHNDLRDNTKMHRVT